MTTLLKKKTIACITGVFFSLIFAISVYTQCPDLRPVELNIFQITATTISYNIAIENIGSDTAIAPDFGIQNYLSNDGISDDQAAGGSVLSWDNDTILPGETFYTTYYSSGSIGAYSHLRVYITDDHSQECDITNNILSRLIYLDTDIVADFEADVTNGSPPYNVQFTDLSTGTPTHWEWDFDNDGTIDSYEQNPVWTISSEEEFSVKLTAWKLGFSDDEVKDNYIKGYPVCPDLVWSSVTITSVDSNEVSYAFELLNVGNDTAFISDYALQNYKSTDGITSSGPAGGRMLDDSNQDYILPGEFYTSNQKAGATFYSDPYLIINIVDGNDLECTTDNNRISVCVSFDTAIFADFQADVTTGTIPFNVQFTDLSTGNPTQWEWDFDNDGTIDSYEQNPEWTVSQEGSYTVSLKASKPGYYNEEIKAGYIVTSNHTFSSETSLAESSWSVYPNPANSNIEVEGDHIIKTVIYDITGKELLQINSKGENKIQIDVNGLKSGIYLIYIEGRNETLIQKFRKL